MRVFPHVCECKSLCKITSTTSRNPAHHENYDPRATIPTFRVCPNFNHRQSNRRQVILCWNRFFFISVLASCAVTLAKWEAIKLTPFRTSQNLRCSPENIKHNRKQPERIKTNRRNISYFEYVLISVTPYCEELE